MLEYKVVAIHDTRHDVVENILNFYGKDGWILSAVDHRTYIFHRKTTIGV